MFTSPLFLAHSDTKIPDGGGGLPTTTYPCGLPPVPDLCHQRHLLPRLGISASSFEPSRPKALQVYRQGQSMQWRPWSGPPCLGEGQLSHQHSPGDPRLPPGGPVHKVATEHHFLPSLPPQGLSEISESSEKVGAPQRNRKNREASERSQPHQDTKDPHQEHTHTPHHPQVRFPQRLQSPTMLKSFKALE